MNEGKWAEMLTPDNAVLVMIDHQAGLMLYPADIDTDHLRSNAVALAKVAKMHNLPVVLCAAAQGPRGPIGPILPEITELFPHTEVIYRTLLGDWADEEKGKQLTEIYAQHLPRWGMLAIIDEARKTVASQGGK